MARKATLGDLRDALAKINREIVAESGNGQTTNVDILKRMRVINREEIAYLTDKLVDMALTKLLNDVSGRRRVSILAALGPNLFGEYEGIPQLVSVGRGIKKAIGSMTIREAGAWIRAHDAKAVNDRNKEFKRLLEDCRGLMASEDDTLEDVMRRRSEKRVGPQT